MLRRAFSVGLLLLLAGRAGASQTWEHTYGGRADERGIGVVPAGDGFLVAARAESVPGFDAVFLVRTGSSGETLWTRTFVVPGSQVIPSGFADDGAGGGLVVGQIKGPSVDWDEYAVRVDADGDTLWSRRWGVEDDEDFATAACRTRDSGWVVCGYTMHNDQYDVRLDRFSASGGMVWGITSGTPRPDYAYGVTGTWDGGFVVTGLTYPAGSRYSKVYLVRYSDSGSVRWARMFGGDLWDEGRAVVEASNRDIVVAGFSESYGPSMDVYMLRTDSTGQGRWLRTFGFAGMDRAYGLAAAGDGGFLFVGEADDPSSGTSHLYLLRTNGDGRLGWERVYGPAGGASGCAVIALADGGIAAVGECRADSGLGRDVYFVRTDSLGLSGLEPGSPAATRPLRAAPNPFAAWTIIDAPAGVRRLTVVAADGRVVRTLAATGKTRWDGRDGAGQAVPPGVYFLQSSGGPGTKLVKRG